MARVPISEFVRPVLTEQEKHDLFMKYEMDDFGRGCKHYQESEKFRDEIVVYTIKLFEDCAGGSLGSSDEGFGFVDYVCRENRELLDEIEREIGVCDEWAHSDIDGCIFDLAQHLCIVNNP